METSKLLAEPSKAAQMRRGAAVGDWKQSSAKLVYMIMAVSVVQMGDYITELFGTEWVKSNSTAGQRAELYESLREVRRAMKRSVENGGAMYVEVEGKLAEAIDGIEELKCNTIDEMKRSYSASVRFLAMDAFCWSVMLAAVTKQAFAMASMLAVPLKSKLDDFMGVYDRWLVKHSEDMLLKAIDGSTTEQLKFYGHRFSDATYRICQQLLADKIRVKQQLKTNDHGKQGKKM